MNTTKFSKERKFTIAKLEMRPFSITDLLWLSVIIISAALVLFLRLQHSCKEIYLSLFVSGMLGAQTISSPLGIRFRNIYFSVIWLLCSIILAWGPMGITWFLLLTFILYHVVRIIFHKMHHKEFVPYHSGKGSMWRHKSIIEGRVSGLQDKKVSKWLLISGLVLFMLCLGFMVHRPHYQAPCN